MRNAGVRRTVAVLALVGGVSLTGCAGGGGADGGGGEAMMAERGGTAGGVGDPTAPGRSAGEAPTTVTGRDEAGANRTTVTTRAVIRTGKVSLVSAEMRRVRGEIDDLVARHGGYLASEDTVNDRAGRPERSVLVLRIPEPAFDVVMDELTGLARTKRADRSSEDVTTEVIDVDSRVATAQASLARLQRFLRRAERMEDIIRLEEEIASRQAELESLKAQQEYLSDQTSMSTVTVRLRAPHVSPAPEPEEQGFLAGLADGWRALTALLVVLATVAGALLPFAVAFVLVGVPVWLLVRALLRRRTPVAQPEQAP